MLLRFIGRNDAPCYVESTKVSMVDTRIVPGSDESVTVIYTPDGMAVVQGSAEEVVRDINAANVLN